MSEIILLEALRDIFLRQSHWKGGKKRPGHIDFEQCDCDAKRAEEALELYGKEPPKA